MEALNFSLDFVQIDLESALFVSDLLKDLLLFASHRIRQPAQLPIRGRAAKASQGIRLALLKRLARYLKECSPNLCWPSYRRQVTIGFGEADAS